MSELHIDKEKPNYTLVMIGSVGDGKSSGVKEMTRCDGNPDGVATQRHSSEKKRNITIKCG